MGLWVTLLDLNLLCASVRKMYLKVVASSLFAILTYERFHRNALDITFLTKICIVKAMFFLIVMYGYESWTIKKAKHWRINASELRCWRRLLRIPSTAGRSNQAILKEIKPEYSLEGLMLKLNSNTLATWYEEPTHWKTSWYWERLTAGGEVGNRGWDGWMVSPTQWTWVDSRR